MAGPAWRLDTSRFPLVLAHVVNGDGRTAPELGSAMQTLEALRALRGQRVVVIDLTFAVPDAARRKLFIDWAKSHWASMRSELLGIACVAPGAFQRSFLTAIFWFVQPACPVEVFERRDAATSWALQMLSDKGLSAPSLRPPSSLSG